MLYSAVHSGNISMNPVAPAHTFECELTLTFSKFDDPDLDAAFGTLVEDLMPTMLYGDIPESFGKFKIGPVPDRHGNRKLTLRVFAPPSIKVWQRVLKEDEPEDKLTTLGIQFLKTLYERDVEHDDPDWERTV